MTLLAELYAAPWAVRPEVLQTVLRYVERHDATPEMLARACHFDPIVQEQAQQARWNRYAVHQQTSILVDGSQALYRRGRTAILPITGPIVRRGNLMSSLSGGPMTSVELLAKDFSRALEDPSFDAILLDVDSPGGEASGISELAAIIASARDEKRIVAYVGDLAASAAYWLASAASEIVVNRTAAVGSIGVVMAVPDPRLDPDGPVEFVSSASPNKRPDPHSKDGKAQIQAMVDVYGDLFVEDVAAYRATDPEDVLADFGRGGLRIGADAVAYGMADRLGSFEETLAGLSQRDERADEPPPPIPLPDIEPSQPRPGRQRPAREPAALSTTTASEGADMSNLLEGLKQLVASADVPASADMEARFVASNLPTAAMTAATGGTANAVLAGTTTGVGVAPVVDAGDATLRQRLVAAEAENARLKLAQIRTRAQVFARAQADDLRVLPPEADHLVALFCVLASDDETHGPVQTGHGTSTTRVAYLENLMAARQSRKDLTVDVFGDTVAHVLTERSRPRVDPNAPADAEELAELLGRTPTGRATLGRIAGAR